MIKIGIIPPATKTGESEYCRNLINGLKKRDVSIDILDNWILNTPSKKMFIGSLVIKKIIENKNLSILHNIDNLGPYLFKQRNMKVKLITTVHDIAPVILPHLYNPLMRFHFKTILPKIISNSDHIITVSHSTKDDLLSKFKVDENKIRVIPLGIDTSFLYHRVSEERILKKYKIYGKYILYVGTDATRKNLKSLILSFHEMSNKITHNLVLVGPISERYIRKIIRNHLNDSSGELLDRIILAGYVDREDLPIIYSSASLFVFPSLYEGFGFPPLEAMACGTPVVLSNNSSLSEIVGDAGVYIKNPLDPNEISEKVLKVIGNKKLQRNLIKKGFIQSKKYRWEKTIDDTIKLYDELTLDK